MRTTRIPTLALVAAATLGLTACGSDDAATPGASGPGAGAPADLATIAAVQWTDGADGVPVLTFDMPLEVTDGASRLIEDGTGAPLEGGQIISVDYIVYSGVDNTVIYSTYDLGRPDAIALDELTIAPALWAVLKDGHIGARFLFAAPNQPDGSGAASTSSFVAAMTVVGASEVLARAEGDAVAPVPGLPVVTLADNGAPSIDVTGLTKPSELVAQLLIAGAGADVVEGQAITVHYTGWLWDGTQFDSSWTSLTPLTFPLSSDGLIEGWVQGLAGQPVGSQVLLVIPPELGYGDVDQGTIPPGSTLVFVVDILAAN